MNRLMAAVLIGATALPGLASAQEHHGERAQSARSAPQAPAAPPQMRAPAPSFQPRQAPGQPRFNGGQPFGGSQPQPFGGRPGGGPRRFGGGPFGGQQPPAFQRPPGGYDGRAYARRPLAGPPGAAPQGGYRQPCDRDGRDRRVPGYPAPGYQPVPGAGDRGDPHNRFRNDGYRGGAQPFAGVPRGGYGYRPDYNRGGGWNRSWREDRRYDWGSYRRYNGELFRLPRYSAPYGYGYGYQRVGIGVVLEEQLFAPDYWIEDPYTYRLPPVDGPYRWVRYYNDALLVDMESGEVVDVVYGIFY